MNDPLQDRIQEFLAKWGRPGRMDELGKDLSRFMTGCVRAGEAVENEACAELLEARCVRAGPACLVSCTHGEDARAIRARMPRNPVRNR